MSTTPSAEPSDIPLSPLPPKDTRIHYMDNLRAYAMLLGIVFHAALAYSPLVHGTWLSADSQQSTIIDFFAWFSHLFRMPIFFLIAGFFMLFLIEKRGVKSFIKNRAQRILIPFLIFLPLILVSFILVIGYGMSSVENLSPMLQFIVDMEGNPDAPATPPNTSHLWFLYNLLFFYIAVLGIYKTNVVSKINAWMNQSPVLFLLIFPLLTVPAFLSQPLPHPAPESFIPQLWSFGFYGLYFFLGFCLFKNQVYLSQIRVFWPFLLGASVGAYIWLFQLFPEPMPIEEAIALGGMNPPITADHIFAAFLEAYIAFFATIAFLLIGRGYLNMGNKFSRYIADASYWIYIIHLPLLFFIQSKLLDVEWNLWVEFIVSNVATLGIGLITYALFVRWTFIGKLLNGKKRPIFKSS